MKKIFALVVLLALLSPVASIACSGGCKGGDCGICSGVGSGTFDEPPITSGAAVSTTTLASLVKAKVPLALIDCRSGGCLSGKRIPGSKIFNSESKDDELTGMITSKDLLVIVFDGYPKCCARQPVAERLKKLGYLNVLEYPGGIQGWMSAGLGTIDAPVVPGTPAAPASGTAKN